MTLPFGVHRRDVLPGECFRLELAAAAEVHLATKPANDVDLVVQGGHPVVGARGCNQHVSQHVRTAIFT